jgi:hypothetical protein
MDRLAKLGFSESGIALAESGEPQNKKIAAGDPSPIRQGGVHFFSASA